MANHKKKRHPNARAHCHMCKPWKDGIYSKENPEFEAFSAHKKRVFIKNDVLEEWQSG